MHILTPKRATQAGVGDIIVRHPDHRERSGEWTITAIRTTTDHLMVELDYLDAADGQTGEFVVDRFADLLVRLSEHLTEGERRDLYNRMTETEWWHFGLCVKDEFPAAFDAAVAFVGRVRTEDEAAGR